MDDFVSINHEESSTTSDLDMSTEGHESDQLFIKNNGKDYGTLLHNQKEDQKDLVT